MFCFARDMRVRLGGRRDTTDDRPAAILGPVLQSFEDNRLLFREVKMGLCRLAVILGATVCFLLVFMNVSDEFLLVTCSASPHEIYRVTSIWPAKR